MHATVDLNYYNETNVNLFVGEKEDRGYVCNGSIYFGIIGSEWILIVQYLTIQRLNYMERQILWG